MKVRWEMPYFLDELFNNPLTLTSVEVEYKDYQHKDCWQLLISLSDLGAPLACGWGSRTGSPMWPESIKLGERPRMSQPQTLPPPTIRAKEPQREALVCSGVSVGLPGGEEVFSHNNIQLLLQGENRISPITKEQKEKLLEKKIVRVTKNAKTGQGHFHSVTTADEVINNEEVKKPEHRFRSKRYKIQVKH